MQLKRGSFLIHSNIPLLNVTSYVLYKPFPHPIYQSPKKCDIKLRGYAVVRSRYIQYMSLSRFHAVLSHFAT